MDTAQKLGELFHPNESPYFAMYSAGLCGIAIEDVAAYLQRIGVPIRNKDIENWKNGFYKNNVRNSILNPIFDIAAHRETKVAFEDLKFFPDGWTGCEQRFFPCTKDNRPMCKWGWSRDYSPTLYDYASAKALSPIGWVGQNMLYQRFIVIDIDGVGHGCMDRKVIEFGNQFRNVTMCLEDPVKPGSFHLYFETDRIVPVRHYPWAKLDLMGNAVNAAVYLKNKVTNGLPMAKLTQEIWDKIMEYIETRKENNYVAQSV